MRVLSSAAMIAFLGAASAAGQDVGIVAELPGAITGYPQRVFVVSLVRGGPKFLVNVTPTSIRTWPVGRVSEPVISALPEDATAYGTPAFADFDGDGVLDVALTAANQIDFLKGDGVGGFVPAGVLPTETQAYVLAGGDFDGDGRADLVAVQSYQIPQPILSCFLSKGAFVFAPARTTVVTPCCGVNSITAGDLDGDGRADVVSAGHGAVSVWRSVGDGTFVLSQSISTYDPSQVILADLDGDSRPDLVFRVSYPFPPFPILAYKNDGGGQFHLLGSISTSPYADAPIVVDVDGDGHPEIVFREQSETAKPYLSTWKLTGGAFVESRLSLPDTHMAFVAAVDWYGDGRPEFVGAGRDRLQIFGASGTRTDVVVVPVLLSTAGLLGSRFDSDLLLTNSGKTPAHAALTYTAAAGDGSGTTELDLAAGHQLYAASAVAYLRDAGLAITTEGNVVGTLRIEVTGASSPGALSASVRTTTPAGAGVAYGGTPSVSLLRGSSVIPWLVETAKDRTNLALVNAGAPTDGQVSLRVEVHAGDLSAPIVLPNVVLAPGAFLQIGRVLAAAGLAAPLGWARITRVAGNAPYLAWAAVNDAGSGDGSFIPALAEDAELFGPWIVPSAVQTERYATEFVAANPEAQPLALQVTLVATGTVLTETLAPGATFYLPDLFAELRRRGLPGAPAAGEAMVSPVYIKRNIGVGRIYAGIRVSSAPAAGVSYGVFEPAMPQDPLFAFSAVVPDLRQDSRTRTNLGILNLYPSPISFRLEITDGETGELAASTDVQLAANELRQLNAVLNDMAPGTKHGWARVTPILQSGQPTQFAAYAVVNDGAEPGQGTGDGSFVLGIPE